MEESKSVIEFKHLKIINRILESGERVEIVPTKDGVKIFKIVRRESKEYPKNNGRGSSGNT